VSESLLHISEPEGHDLVDVAAGAVVVNARIIGSKAIFRGVERMKRLVLNVDEVQRLERGEFVTPNDGRHGIADEADAIDGEGMLVLADRQDSVGHRKIATREHQMD